MKKIFYFLVCLLMMTSSSEAQLYKVRSQADHPYRHRPQDLNLRGAATKTICSAQTNINPNSCDYVCDGTDDDVQIQAAITAIQAGSGVGAAQGSDGTSGKGSIVFSEGLFTLGSTVSLKPGISFYGQGITGTKIRAKNNLNADMFAYNAATPAPSAGVIFRDIFFDGNDGGNTSGNIFDTKTGTVALWDLIIESCYIFDCAGTCLEIDDPFGFRLYNSHIEDSTGYAIEINKGSDKTQGAIITGNKIIQNGKGVRFNDIDAAIFTNNEINTSGNSQKAVEIIQTTTSGNGNLVFGNKFWVGTNGVFVDTGCVATVVANNLFSGLSETEIADYGTNTIIQGNRGDDAGTNTDNVANIVNFVDGDVKVNSDNDASGDFSAATTTYDTFFAIDADQDKAYIGNLGEANYLSISASGFDNIGTFRYLVGVNESAFAYDLDTDAALVFGTGYEFRDLDGVAGHNLKLDGDHEITGDGGAREIIMGRELTDTNAGSALSLEAGGADSGSTDKDGGALILRSGIAVGNGESRIVFQTVDSGQGTGTTDRTQTTRMQLDEGNHLEFLGGAVSVSSGCGSGPAASTGFTDTQGIITMGTGTVTSCILNFYRTWTNAPACIVSGDQASVTYAASTSATQLTITSSATMDGDKVAYHCFGGE